jgi:Uma2 family endonuclease
MCCIITTSSQPCDEPGEGAVNPKLERHLRTFEEFCGAVREDQKADLIDGVIYMASPENTDANEIFLWLTSILHPFVRRKQLGRVLGSRVAFRLGERSGPEPDIAIVRADRLHLVHRGYVDGPPDMAIEVVSPESVDRDYKDKRKQYQDAKVSEYWIVDELDQEVTLLRLNDQGRYREVRPKQGVLRSSVVEGFWLRTEWLWLEPLPDAVEILIQLIDE